MDKNTWIGFLLIAAIIVGFSMFNRPSKEELEAQRRYNDSIALIQAAEQASAMIEAQQMAEMQDALQQNDEETASQKALDVYGNFAPSAFGNEDFIVKENDVLRLTFATHGGSIYKAELLDYKTYGDSVNPLCLFEGDEADIDFTFTTNQNRYLHTQDMFFTPVETDDDNKTILRLLTSVEDAYLDFVYTLDSASYMIRFEMVPHNMDKVLALNMGSIEMKWSQLIRQQERGRKFEDRYATLQYMFIDHDISNLKESKDDHAKESADLRWIAYKDQFFSTVLIADNAISSAELDSKLMRNGSGYIKEYATAAYLEYDAEKNNQVGFSVYLGPNKYNLLKSFDKGKDAEDKLLLKSLVPLGWKIVAWINYVLVIPMFDLFTGWGLHIGLVILLMTLVIKLIILPFVFTSYKSTAKMRVLKPQMDAINEKYPADKMQERQQATMALYRDAGVSPMSGCLPMLFQFPILMAMFWFFPTAIELRGQSFLWADDLSAYDAIFTWSTNLPLIGNHLSLFCLLMTATNIAYTYITMQSQAGGDQMKVMKYMMYLMPLMFFFIFNDYAAGLSYYYLLSLFFTIMQTMIFRWAIDDKKILAEMERKKAMKGSAPKKKSGFAARIEKMQREQQAYMREQAKKNARR